MPRRPEVWEKVGAHTAMLGCSVAIASLAIGHVGELSLVMVLILAGKPAVPCCFAATQRPPEVDTAALGEPGGGEALVLQVV